MTQIDIITAYQNVKGELNLAISLVVNEIKRLSQEEGLNDKEIANILGCSRITVYRARESNNIPKANLKNKKDKTYTCALCGKTVYIRRHEKRQLYCKECFQKNKINVTNQK